MKTLKNVLLLNSLSSGATGILLMADASFIANIFQFPETAPFIGVGAFLFVFAVLVFLVQRSDAPQRYTHLIIAADLLWVLVSAVIVGLQLFKVSAIGYLLISLVALWVAAMAWFQYAALKKVFINKTVVL